MVNWCNNLFNTTVQYKILVLYSQSKCGNMAVAKASSGMHCHRTLLHHTKPRAYILPPTLFSYHSHLLRRGDWNNDTAPAPLHGAHRRVVGSIQSNTCCSLAKEDEANCRLHRM
jgi:hypothetical protein